MGDHAFCRAAYSEIMIVIKKITTPAERQQAWVIKTGSPGRWEFQWREKKVYWYGRAHCAWDAKCYGWTEYLNLYHPEILNKIDQTETEEPRKV